MASTITDRTALAEAAVQQRAPLTAIVLTFNEQENMAACLRRLDWVDEVLVVDSFSSDDTLEVVREIRPDARILQHAFEDFGQQRNWALDEGAPRHPWVLFVDADEEINAECAAAIRRAIESDSDKVGFYLTCRNYFLGRWIKRSTLYPSWQLRLLKLGEVRYCKEGHGQREVTDGPLGYLREPYDHYGFSKGIAHWIARHNQYSTDEVDLILRLKGEPLSVRDVFSQDPVRRRRFAKRCAARVGLLRPLARFLHSYVWRLGFLDGYPGLLYNLLRLSHEIHISVKLAERGLDRDHTRCLAAESAAEQDCWHEVPDGAAPVGGPAEFADEADARKAPSKPKPR